MVSDPQQLNKMSHLSIDTCALDEYFPNRIGQAWACRVGTFPKKDEVSHEAGGLLYCECWEIRLSSLTLSWISFQSSEMFLHPELDCYWDIFQCKVTSSFRAITKQIAEAQKYKAPLFLNSVFTHLTKLPSRFMSYKKKKKKLQRDTPLWWIKNLSPLGSLFLTRKPLYAAKIV